MMLSVPLASRAFSTTFCISHGDKNCPFLIFTGRPQRATACMKSVCRQRKDRKSTRLNSSHTVISYDVLCLKKKKKKKGEEGEKKKKKKERKKKERKKRK